MSGFHPGRLQLWTGGIWRGAEPRHIGGFTNDTRALAPRDCFAAIATDKRDGHNFLGDAARAGAAAALVSRYIADSPLPQLVVDSVLPALQRAAAAHRASLRAPVLGVTGSAGKTSTKDLLAAMLSAGAGRALATQGNLNNGLGVPLTLLRARASRHTAGAVIEAGTSAPGELEALAQIIRADVAVATNVLPAHLAGLGALETVAREKSALARHAQRGGAAVFPASLLTYATFREAAAQTRAFPVVFGEAGENAGDNDGNGGGGGSGGAGGGGGGGDNAGGGGGFVRAVFSPAPGGWRVDITGLADWGSFDFFIPECSDGMLRNAALAAVAALLAGAREADIRAAAARWRPSPGRGEILLRGGRLFYVDCYNANPDSMLDAARAFDRRTTTPTATATTGIGENKNATANEPPEGAGRGNADINEPPASVGRGNADANEPPGSTGRVFVLGGMNELGPDSILWHERVGRALPLRRGDRLFLFGGDSPAIGAGAVAAGFPETAVRSANDIAELREWLAATTGAVFLKASRTHALERALPPADRAK